MSRFYQKLKNWYRGKYVSLPIQEMIERQHPKLDVSHGDHIPAQFKPPLIVRIIKRLCRFWLRHWKWIIGTIIIITLAIIGCRKTF